MRRFLVLSAALLMSFAAAPVHAQQGTAQISGRVTDEQGAVLPGVSVAITNEDTGVAREVDEQRRRHVFGGPTRAGHATGWSAKLDGVPNGGTHRPAPAGRDDA